LPVADPAEPVAMTVPDPPALVDPATKQVAPIVKAVGYALGYALGYDLYPLYPVGEAEESVDAVA